MKKVFWVLFILPLLVIGASLLSRHQYSKKFESDYEMLEREMLLPDSNNKGYSDQVKKNIDNQFKDEKVRDSLYKEAKAYREVERSKTREEFIEKIECAKSLTTKQCADRIGKNLDKIEQSSEIYYVN